MLDPALGMTLALNLNLVTLTDPETEPEKFTMDVYGAEFITARK